MLIITQFKKINIARVSDLKLNLAPESAQYVSWESFKWICGVKTDFHTNTKIVFDFFFTVILW